jgi:hypothetical protein
MATAALTQPTLAPTLAPNDPIQRWLDRRAAVNRANSEHSTGPRTESGKQRSSLNALQHGLTAQTALLPNEDPEVYQSHLQKYLAHYQPATPIENQLVHEMATNAWRFNRIPAIEAKLLSQDPSPKNMVQQLATLGLYGSRLSRQIQNALDKLRDIQDDRRRLERRQLNEAAELLMRHQHKGLSWDPAADGFVFSIEQIQRHARYLMRLNPAFYAALTRPEPAPPPTRTAFR